MTIKRYRPQRKTTPNVHHYLTSLEAGVLNAQAVARVALDLKKSGFVPDVMLSHNGWGEIWYQGFPGFMRSLPKILQKRPNVQVLIVGG